MLQLTERDKAYLNGDHGPGAQLAMTVVTHTAETMQASSLLDVTSAHVDSCVFYGIAGLDFARRLVDGGARVSIPTTLNISSLDLLHPELYRGDAETRELARQLTDLYLRLGGEATWTCAPYQLPKRPGFGEQIAWAESNAIVFANSVIGARTNRYGDFIDISCAITGRAPAAGLHLESERPGTTVFTLEGISGDLTTEDVFFPVLGHLIGKRAGNGIPVIEGLTSSTTEDQLKALGAAAASSGSVALFHAVGVTPEAASTDEATGGREVPGHTIASSDIAEARDELTTSSEQRLDAVSIGTPHLSRQGFASLIEALDGATVHPDIRMYVNTGRVTLADVAQRGWLETLERAGVTVVTDTCTYVTPILEEAAATVMTDSGKWAWYAPANLGVDVVFGSMQECVRSAVAGEVVRDPGLWHGL